MKRKRSIEPDFLRAAPGTSSRPGLALCPDSFFPSLKRVKQPPPSPRPAPSDTASSRSLTRANLIEAQARLSRPRDSVGWAEQSLSSTDSSHDSDMTRASSSRASASTSLDRTEDALEAYRIYIDRGMPLPKELQDLVKDVQQDRQGEVTPQSKMVKQLAKDLRRASEAKIIHEVADKLIYTCQLHADGDGEKMMASGHNDQWRLPTPIPTPAPSELTLSQFEELMGRLKLPRRPRPDISYGYCDAAFTDALASHRRRLSDALIVFPKAPWFPYMIVQWKSAQEPIAKAQCQARRDGAVACKAMHDLFCASGVSSDASMTCCFSLCANVQQAEFRIHWRREDTTTGHVSWEADMVESAHLYKEEQVYRLRGCILRALEWARNKRFDNITAALNAYPTSQPGAPDVSSMDTSDTVAGEEGDLARDDT